MNSQFQQELREAVLNALNHIELSGPYVIGWDNRSARILQVLLAEEVLSRDAVLDRLSQRLKEMGRFCFRQHQRGEYPDHTASPEAFAYALHHREFSRAEEVSIRFDHCMTITSFVDEYNFGDRLRERVFNKLTTERRLPMATADFGGVECLESH